MSLAAETTVVSGKARTMLSAIRRWPAAVGRLRKLALNLNPSPQRHRGAERPGDTTARHGVAGHPAVSGCFGVTV
jgi:hypothetical protein